MMLNKGDVIIVDDLEMTFPVVLISFDNKKRTGDFFFTTDDHYRFCGFKMDLENKKLFIDDDTCLNIVDIITKKAS